MAALLVPVCHVLAQLVVPNLAMNRSEECASSTHQLFMRQCHKTDILPRCRRFGMQLHMSLALGILAKRLHRHEEIHVWLTSDARGKQYTIHHKLRDF